MWWLCILPLIVVGSANEAPIDIPTDLCPGGVPPLFEYIDGKTMKCEALNIKTHLKKKYCCPKIISIDTAVFIPSWKDKMCNSSSECAQDEFCGYAVDEKENKGNQPLCHKRPVCGGRAVVKDTPLVHGEVVAKCEKDDECGQIKEGSFCSKEKVCCSFESTSCPPIPEVPTEKLKDLAIVFTDTTHCKHCKKKTPCEVPENIENLRKNSKNLNLEKFLCTKTPDGLFRMCGYHIDKPRCPLNKGTLLRNSMKHAAFDDPQRHKKTNHVKECTFDKYCFEKGTAPAVCENNTVSVGAKKICCPIHACPSDNFFTGYTDSHKCSSNEDCTNTVGSGECVHGYSKQFCCPKALPSKKKDILNIQGPFKTGRPCANSGDCKHDKLDGLFCDPETLTCIYHVEAGARKKYAVKGTCVAAEKTCPALKDKLKPVCMYDWVAKKYGCFRHVLDECTKNSECTHLPHGVCYCHQIPDQNGNSQFIAYEGGECLYRKCGSGAGVSKPYIDPKSWGLQFCTSNDQCPVEAFCMTITELLMNVKINNKVCNAKPVIPCHGKASLKYLNNGPDVCRNTGECAYHGENFFCDKSANFKKYAPWINIEDGRGICCSLPTQCGGELEYLPDNSTSGITTCKSSSDCEQGICSTFFEKEKENNWNPDEGVCCKMTCDKKYPEVIGSVNAEKFLCGKGGEGDCTSTKNTVARCEDAPGAATPYKRCCKYNRIEAQCPGVYANPLRDSFEVRSCKSYMDCRTAQDGGASCVEPINDIGLEKICCPDFKCTDQYTVSLMECGDSDECPPAEDEGTKGKCTLVRGDKGCCPIVENIEEVKNGAYAIVSEYYSIGTHCNALIDCIGESRFCEPTEGNCKYYGTNNLKLRKQLKSPKNCDENKDSTCGELENLRTVCMAEVGGVPKCYQHPLETCTENSECGEDEYCAPSIVDTANYKVAYRICHMKPSDSVLAENGQGLKVCKTDNDCEDTAVFCHLSSASDQSVPVRHGFCQFKERIGCRGTASFKYDNEKPFVCQTNSECEPNEFCDLGIQRPPWMTENKGICCSIPEKCGGEVVLNEPGLKTCTSDKDCNLEEGELCSMSFEKVQGSIWPEGEGVCCKFTCPASKLREASNKTVVAGEKCDDGDEKNCETDHLYFRSCLDAPEANYKRCCSYERRKELCPVHIGSVQIDDKGMAKLCQENSCEDREVCHDGFCCKPSTCPDTYTELYLEKECDNEKDCDQAEGFAAVCHMNKCCPKTYGSLIDTAFLSNIICSSVADCPYRRMYCNATHGRCAYIENSKELQSMGKCESENSLSCTKNGQTGVCIYLQDERNGLPSCSIDGKIKIAEKQEETVEEESNTGLIVGLVIGAVVLLVVAGVIGFVIYRIISKKNAKKKKKLNRFQMPTKRASTPPKGSTKEVKTHQSSKPAPTPSGRSMATMTPRPVEGAAVVSGGVTPSHSHHSSIQAPPNRNSNLAPSSHADQAKSRPPSTISVAGSREATNTKTAQA